MQAPVPKRLSVLLTLTALGGLVVFLAALAFVAARLAAEFDANARNDAAQRVESGLQAMIGDLEAVSRDYSEWTAHYQALIRQDAAWLEENVGTAAYAGELTQLVVLGGGPLESVLGWSVGEYSHFDQAAYEALLSFAEADAERHSIQSGSIQPDELPLSYLQWVDDELWLITANRVVPHTGDVEPVLPTAMLLVGFPLRSAVSSRFGDTLLLSEVRIDLSPGMPGASRELVMVEGPSAWISWKLPRPGTDAILAMSVPMGFALGAIVLLLGFGTYAVRRLALRLENALLVAEEASRTKSAFLTTMSHELRTPLNAVLGMADLLGETGLKKTQREMVATIQEAGRGLLFVVNDILDLARVESGKLTLEDRPFDLASLLARLESVHGATARGKGIILQVCHPAENPRQRLGDEMRVAQILHNIVGNAVKFTEAGSVTVDVRAEDAHFLQFCVTDTGIGMTEDQVARVFEPFEQADAGTTRRFGGSGLGMSIVRRLIDMMGGSISVDSIPGQGTRVSMTLPLPQAGPSPDLTADAPRDQGAQTGTQLVLADCRLLVAEDNATNRKIIGMMLSKLGVRAIFAENGQDACALWRDGDFDLVLMDISMPVLDGFAAMEIMNRESEALGRAPPRVIAATANVMKTQIDDYRTRGFVDVLAKPYQRADLQETLSRQMRLKTEA
ncbi:MAG: ATP-binding protein [Pararhodobacter sp.]